MTANVTTVREMIVCRMTPIGWTGVSNLVPQHTGNRKRVNAEAIVLEQLAALEGSDFVTRGRNDTWTLTTSGVALQNSLLTQRSAPCRKDLDAVLMEMVDMKADTSSLPDIIRKSIHACLAAHPGSTASDIVHYVTTHEPRVRRVRPMPTRDNRVRTIAWREFRSGRVHREGPNRNNYRYYLTASKSAPVAAPPVTKSNRNDLGYYPTHELVAEVVRRLEGKK